jgi:hypothetical protein
MSDNRTNLGSKRPDWADRLGRLASLVGSALALVAALGFPSASLQYFHLRIPLQFLSYDRALRAGVLPALVLTLLVAGLYAIGYLASRAFPRALGGNGSWFDEASLPIRIILYPLLIVLWFLGLAVMLVMSAGMFVWLAFPFVLLAKSFGLWLMFIALAVLLGVDLLLSRLVFRGNLQSLWARSSRRVPRTTVRPAQNNPGSDTDMDQPETAIANGPFDGQPFAGLQAGLSFGAWFVGALFTLRWASQSWFTLKFHALPTTFILAIGIAVGVAMFAAFFAPFSAPAFSSQDRKKRLLAWAELVVTGLLIYTSFSWLYADRVYTAVPQFLGGGRPDPVIAEISINDSQINLSMALPSAQCSHAGAGWVCRNLYLVNARSQNWVVTDTQEAYGHALVIPEAEFTLIQGR